ncbi:MAG TPA: bifunctional aspartate kinase/diaminopimelate decarboxylase [Thermoanaerobaculia bacterium]|nr:bifunctional aspartate kinase/diaminopimelate decarboxylase [Thermoanaerobaculia bacterium]
MGTRWVVLKFGGTSVSSPERWRTIASLAEERMKEGLRPLVVCSAMTRITSELEGMLGLAVRGEHEEALRAIVARHLELGAGLGIDTEALLRDDLDELTRLALAASLLREAGPRLKARVMAFGELLSTRLGAAFLEARGVPATWFDAREGLVSLDDPRKTEAPRAYLSATCGHERDEALRQRLDAERGVVVTQGFIARNAAGETVLLGRGGSDTSAALLAARIGAERCEVWTDVPGMFTANPALLPSARLLRALDYEEAQEIAITGAKVLHPRCIPPLRRHRIPLHVRCTDRPELPGTVVSAAGPETGPAVKAISARSGITLVSMETLGMWQQVGFLAEVFATFARHGLSIDSVSTSETNVTVSLDPGANVLEEEALAAVSRDLEGLCEPRVIAPTAALSLVGRGIRGILHELSPVLEVFEEMKVHLVTQAASDLNLTFMVDEDQSERLVRQLHGLLFGHQTESAVFGPTWAEMFGESVDTEGESVAVLPEEWWRGRRDELLVLAAEHGPVYVYDAGSLDRAAESMRSLGVFDHVFYSVKANCHPGVLARFEAAGIGFECVSAPELEHVTALFPGIEAERVLFTPNFAPAAEYRRAFELGAWVTIDSLHPLRAWPDVFRGREVLVRLDPGRGQGHHAHVRTAGAQSKFGVDPENLGELRELAAGLGVRIVGLHAHSGSGIRDARSWRETALFLAGEADRFPDVRILDVGGGLGVPERPGQGPLDLEELSASLRLFRAANPRFQLWIEPGRFLVAQAGVLLARVVQVKRKREVTYVGAETGMNSLIRPALYGAYHLIVNLTRLGQPTTMLAHVVGPICETGDILGRSRRLAPAEEGDVLLIANAGAYGRVMSSRYNLREPAGEMVLLPSASR